MDEQVTESVGTLARGISINMFGSGYNIASRLLFNVVIARLLGPQQAGIYYLALTVATMMGMMSVAGLDTTVIRFLSRHRIDNDWGAFRGTLHFAIRTVGGLGLTGSLLLLVGARWMAVTVFHKPEVTIPLRIVAFYVPLFALEALLLAATQSFKQMKYKVYIDAMLNPTLRILLAVSVYLLGGRVYAVLGSYVFSLMVCATLSFFALRKCITVDLGAYAPITDRREILSYWYPLIGVGTLSFMILYVDTFVLAHLRSTAEVGLYSICIRVIIIEGFFVGVVSQIFGPMISEMHRRSEIERLSTYSKVVTLWSVEVFAPMALLFVVAPREVLGLFGPGFRAAAPCLIILVLGQFVGYVTGPVGLIINMAGWTRLQLWNTCASLILQTVLAFVLIPPLGILGAAFANSTGVISLNLMQLFEVQHRLRFHPFSGTLVKPFLAVLSGLAAAWLAGRYLSMPNSLHVAVACAVMLFAYAATLILLGFDEHSRIAWQQIRDSILPRLSGGRAGVVMGK